MSLRLLLATRPISQSQGQPVFVDGDCFRMGIFARPDGSAQMSSSRRQDGVITNGILTTVPAPEWSALEGSFLSLPGWREKQCDGGEPEGQVLYTLLEIETSEGRFVSQWRGLPRPQADVANLLLSSAVGPPLRQGLAELTKPDRK
ncbi:hypothetical protein JST97_17665 [bacterium]|nr:hypothetical protein [bacterium]